MPLRIFFLLVALIALLPGCTGKEEASDSSVSSAVTQANLQKIANHLDVNYRVVANRSGGHCTGESGSAPCYIAQLQLTSPVPIKATDWSIYFSQVNPLIEATSVEFAVEHINGDLHRLYPTEKFQGFKSGETKGIEMVVSGLVLNTSKLMPNYYVVAEGLEPRVIASTQVTEDPETGLELRPYAILPDSVELKNHPQDLTQRATSQRLYQDNKNLTYAPEVVGSAIIPTPASMTLHNGRLDLADGLALHLHNIQQAAVQPALDRLALLGVAVSDAGVPVHITVAEEHSTGEAEAYTLEVNDQGITIKAGATAGALYGLESVAALLAPGQTDIPYVSIEDAPRYPFRGVHIDVARNFHSKELLLKIMDQMAAYKLNKLHLHLGDDEGWRLEIKGLPELTEIGSQRCHDPSETRCLMPQLGSGPYGNTQVDGYYTIEEYKDILRAASARNIQVIPSFDMPGHSRAVIKAMEARYRKYMAQGKEEEAKRYLLTDFEDTTVYDSIQHYDDNTINVCLESTYRFIDKVMDEMQAVHAAAGQPLTLYHIGADETAGAWMESPVCHKFLANNEYGVEHVEELGAYFIERVANMLAEKGIKVAGWSDGLGETNPAHMPDDVQSNVWTLLPSAHKVAHQQANYGWDVVVSTPSVLYFDFPQAADPQEHGYYWGSRETTVRDVFNFMPDNLPVHAEFRTDKRGQPYIADDRVQRNDAGEITHRPLQKGHEFIGIQGHIWSETLRSDDLVEYMLFPRMIALAERAWHKPDWAVPYNYEGALYSQETNAFTEDMRKQRDAAWNRFANVLAQKALPKLDLANIQYRLPTVGAVVEDGVLKANVSFPGLAIEYRVDGGDWRLYEGPVKVEGEEIQVRSMAPNGERKGRTLTIK